MNLAHLLLRQARLQPGRSAIYEGTAPHASWHAWAARSAGLASRLREAGLALGDRVLISMRNHPRYLELLWGAWWAGLVVVPVNAKLHPQEVGWIADHAGAHWAFVTRDVAPERIAGVRRQVDAESAEADALGIVLSNALEVDLRRSGGGMRYLDLATVTSRNAASAGL